MQRLDMVLPRIGQLNLKVKPEKCQFYKQLRFFGHLDSEDGISQDPEKTRTVREWNTPKNEEEPKPERSVTVTTAAYVSVAVQLTTAEVLGTAWVEEMQIRSHRVAPAATNAMSTLPSLSK